MLQDLTQIKYRQSFAFFLVLCFGLFSQALTLDAQTKKKKKKSSTKKQAIVSQVTLNSQGKITDTGQMTLVTKGVQKKSYMTSYVAFASYYTDLTQGKDRANFEAIKKSKNEFVLYAGMREQTYAVMVPESASEGLPMGLMIWNSPGGKGRVNGKWTQSLEDRNIIWIGPNDIGNEVYSPYRMAAMVEAIDLAKKRFNIDPNRIYIAGHSGGARVTSIFAQQAPELISGAFYFAGLNITAPKREALTTDRHVLFFSKDDKVATYVPSYYQKLSSKYPYKSFLYLETKGFGHGLPSSEWFEKGMDYLEKPLEDMAVKAEIAIKRLKNGRQKDGLLKAYQQVALYGRGTSSESARQEARSLQSAYDTSVTSIESQIEKASSLQDYKAIGLAIAKFKSEWGKMGKIKGIELTKKMAEAKRRR